MLLLFSKYLNPHGKLRIACVPLSNTTKPAQKRRITVFGDSIHKDKNKLHVSYPTDLEIVDEFSKAGFINIKMLEQTKVIEGRIHVYTSSWDQCEGLVRRSVKHDVRNRDKIGLLFRKIGIALDALNNIGKDVFVCQNLMSSTIVEA